MSVYGVSGTAAPHDGVTHGVQPHGRGGDPATHRIHIAGLVLLSAHLLIVGWLALRPLSVPWIAPANLQPLATIRTELERGPHAAMMVLGDALLLLAPLGVLLPLATGGLHRPLAGTLSRTVLAGLMISLGVALLQSGIPGHVIDVDTILLNATGVALATLFLFPPLRSFLRRRTGSGGGDLNCLPQHGGSQSPLRLRDETSQGPAPRRAGVGIAP